MPIQPLLKSQTQMAHQTLILEPDCSPLPVNVIANLRDPLTERSITKSLFGNVSVLTNAHHTSMENEVRAVARRLLHPSESRASCLPGE